MLIVFDVGNSETTIGLYDHVRLVGHWRITTDVGRTADEFGLLLLGLLNAISIAPSHVNASAIGSVVPPITAPLGEACAKYLGAPPVIVDARAPLPITVAVDEPLSVGADRLINTLAASRLYKRDTICVDLGTATTFDCITSDGVFLGGVIMPGVRTSADTLTRRTSKLPATEIIAPQRVIGTRTEECIRAGVVFGSADAIDGIVRRIKREWPRPQVPYVVATGGLAEVFKPYCESFDLIAPYLTLDGLRMAHEILSTAPSAAK